MMLKHALFLLFLYGIKNGRGSPQDQAEESRDVLKNGIKKNEVGANGLEANWEKVARNFQNPVLVYLLRKNPERTSGGPPGGGLIRETRHSQTLLFPSFPGGPLPGLLPNQLPHLESQTKSSEGGTRNPDDLPFDSFWNYLKNKTQLRGTKIQESVISSPVLHLSKNPEGVGEEWARIQMFPAVAVVIHSFNKDGSLKSSVTHFQPDFKSILTTRPEIIGKEAIQVAGGKSPNKTPKNPTTVSGYVKPDHNSFSGGSSRAQETRQVFSWPFANYFPVVINDPYSSVHNAYVTGMYNAVSSIVEYGPGADICLKEKAESENREVMNRRRPEDTEKVPAYYRNEQSEVSVTNIFGEVTTRSDGFDRNDRKQLKRRSEDASFQRKRRDTTSIYVKSREGDTVDVTLQEPTGSDDAVNTPDERARSFGPVLVNTPPLSTILRPPQQGYADKRKKTKPPKPIKEEGSSEEVGEEHEEENTSQSQENTNEAVAISPPPEGASVAEAKPIGLAIAGPGGVAASKPQGTAVAGPGGLAIARPVGTAIAGVEVEGSVPIGGQQKNKKKPKQEKEQTDAELHYVGGLTGPIGNPQPKEFADSIYYKTVRETEENNIQENLLLRGQPNTNGFQLKLGQQNGKYGFVPVFANTVPGDAIPQKRVDFPTFFHGLLGNNGHVFDQFQNYRARF